MEASQVADPGLAMATRTKRTGGYVDIDVTVGRRIELFEAGMHDSETKGRVTPTRPTPLVLVMTAAALLLPAGACASPLLSGYGGPGGGSQVIIGAALVNGPSGGSGGGSGGAAGGGAPGSGEAAGSSAQSESASAGNGSGSGAGGGQGGSEASGGGSAASGGSTHGTGSSAGSAHEAPGAAQSAYAAAIARQASTESQVLGLSGRDLLFALVVLAVLLGTGLLTGRLAHENASEESRTLKGSPRALD